MAWTLGSVRIYVQELGEEAEQIIPRLQPLNGGTVMQIYGYQDPITSIKGLVVSTTDMNLLESYLTSGTEFLFTSPEGSLGNFFVKSVKSARSEFLFQTIRPDLDCMTPVYVVDVALYKDN